MSAPRGSFAAAACVVVGALVLTACTQPAEASDLATPDIVWERGEPSGELWETTWAAAYLKAFQQRALADAYGDYSDPDFVAAVGYEAAVEIAESNADRRFGSAANQRRYYDADAMWAYYGDILAIEEAPDGKSAVVQACDPGRELDEIVPMSGEWTITLAPDGSHSVSYAVGPLMDECRTTEPWIGAWTEPIDILDVGRDEVKMPLPREYYVDLGVISE